MSCHLAGHPSYLSRQPFSVSWIPLTTKLTKDTKNAKDFLNPVFFFVRFVILVFFVVKERSGLNGCLPRIWLPLLLLAGPLCGAEKVTAVLNGKPTECEVTKITKDGAVLKSGAMELTIPLDKLGPKNVARCYRALPPPDSPDARLDMGAYFLSNHLLTEAEEELTAAGSGDAACQAKAAGMLGAVKILREMAASKKEEGPGSKTDASGLPGDPMEGHGEGDELATAFKRKAVPPLSPAEMKAFLDKRLKELKSTLDGDWHMKETRHFYCFTDLPEARLAALTQWNEDYYDLLCRVLRHREGDKLWNNKMPIYYFSSHSKFQHFAVEIDHEPGAARSGGFFSAEGRQVHICIPFLTERYHNDKDVARAARDTLNHEGTHAFLQLSGEDVKISRWLHEGLAQFIEFWYDRENNPARKQRVAYLQQYLARGRLPSWAEMKNRPLGGTDMEGYALAWSKVQFLYWNFPNDKLPQMIRLIKSGKSEEEALAAAFGMPYEKLEAAYRVWVKPAAKAGFNFGQ